MLILFLGQTERPPKFCLDRAPTACCPLGVCPLYMVNLQPTPTPTTDPAASKNMGAIFLKKKSACGNVVSRSGLPKIWWGFQKYGGPFFWEKKRLRQRAHKLRASKNMGAIKKTPAAALSAVQGFQKHGGHFSEKKSACGNVVSR